MMWDVEENGLLGSWHELEPGAGIELDIGGITVYLHRRQHGCEILLLLAEVPFSAALISLVEREYPGYLLLLLREKCYLHRAYEELTNQILRDLHAVTAQLKEWLHAE